MDISLKATFILTMAWIATFFLRRASADFRHRVWLAALIAVAILPGMESVASRMLPGSTLISVSAAAKAAPASFSGVIQAPWIEYIWVTGLIFALARLSTGIVRVTVWTRSARGSAGFRYSGDVRTPLTWGIFHPVILLPSCSMNWPEEERQMVILHERAHIERHDWFWQMFARVLTAIFWFHPLMWLAGAELRREAERATDDRVLLSGAPAADYAAQLVRVARLFSGAHCIAAVAMARGGSFEDRVREVLDKKRSRGRTGRVARLGIAMAAGALILPLAAMQDSEVHRIGEPGLSPPSVVSKVEPQYTEEARTAKIEGTVALMVEIDENGLAKNIRVTRSLDPGLDANGVDAITQWHFEPGHKNGKPVRTEATIEINFRLQ